MYVLKRFRYMRFLCIAVLFFLCMLTGCQKNEKDMAEQIGSIEKDGSAQGQNLKAMLGAEDAWVETIEAETKTGEKAMVKISAKVSLPPTDTMSVVQLEQDSFTQEKKQDILEAVCEADSISDEKPMEAVKAELQQYENLISQWQKKQNDAIETYGIRDESIDEILSNLYHEQETLIESMEGEKKENRQPDYTKDEFYGKLDGRWFHFYFFTNGSLHATLEDIRERELSFPLPENQHCEYYAVKPEEDTEVENQCQISQTKAAQMADAFLEKMKYKEYMLNDCQNLRWEALDADQHDLDSYSYVGTYGSSTVPSTTLGDCG